MTTSNGIVLSKIAVITSRFDITKKQSDGLRNLLPTFAKEKDSFIIGGDDADYDVFLSLLAQGFKVEVYPHSGSTTIGKFNGATISKETLPLRERNKRMIDNCNVVIGVPQIFNEYEDSPAWKTIRYAMQNDKEVYVISPNGYVWGME